jgi:trigger factor
MQITNKTINPTKVELTVVADEQELQTTKSHVLKDVAKDVNFAGFRKGHAPLALVEKSVDPNVLQSQFLDHAINDLYAEAIRNEKLRPVAQPEVNVTKFVPFTSLEFKATVEVVGTIKLTDYKKIKVVKKVEPTSEQDVTAVLDDLRARDSEKKEVKRASKDGDEVTINFNGVDTTTKKALDGASGSEYPLVLGSNTFIPGFEPQLVGMKVGDEKTFDITFPNDYGAKELQNKKVTFATSIKNVKEVQLPKLDDAFAAKVGPFKSLAELKADIKKQLQAEKENQAQRAFENELLTVIADKSTAAIPEVLVEEEIGRMEAEEKRNLVYQGQTWQEHLDAESKTEEQHHEAQRSQAEQRVKTGLVLGEVAETEKISVSQAELDARIEDLKKQYTDPQMLAELSKSENRREIASRILTEKTIDRLTSFASK